LWLGGGWWALQHPRAAIDYAYELQKALDAPTPTRAAQPHLSEKPRPGFRPYRRAQRHTTTGTGTGTAESLPAAPTEAASPRPPLFDRPAPPMRAPLSARARLQTLMGDEEEEAPLGSGRSYHRWRPRGVPAGSTGPAPTPAPRARPVWDEPAVIVFANRSVSSASDQGAAPAAAAPSTPRRSRALQSRGGALRAGAAGMQMARLRTAPPLLRAQLQPQMTAPT
jgi:hypothetical protein